MAWTAPTQRTTGTLITAAIYNTDLVDNFTFLGVNHDHSGDAGDGGNLVRSQWVSPQYVSGTGAVLRDINVDLPAARLVNNQDDKVQFSFRLPTPSDAITKAVIVFMALATGNLYRATDVEFGAAGEAAGGASGASAALAVTANQYAEEDISSALSGQAVAAGDVVGVGWNRNATNALDTAEGDVLVFGLLIEWR